eukprot:730730_1
MIYINKDRDEVRVGQKQDEIRAVIVADDHKERNDEYKEKANHEILLRNIKRKGMKFGTMMNQARRQMQKQLFCVVYKCPFCNKLFFSLILFCCFLYSTHVIFIVSSIFMQLMGQMCKTNSVNLEA